VISVIIATYRRLELLSGCLEAIARQTVAQPLQVCVVNDGGPSIAPVMEKIQDRYPRLSVWYQDLPENRGHIFARNLALTAAKGEYIACCDDDDRWLPNHLSSLLAALSAAGAEWAHADAELVRLARRQDDIRVEGRWPFAWRNSERLLDRYNPIVPSSVLYRRRVHQRIGRLDEQMGHYWDWDFWLRLRRLSAPVRVPVSSVLYAIDADGNNQSANPEKMRQRLRVFTAKHGLGELPAMNFFGMLERPDLAPYRAETRVLWDGNPSIWQ
jgi:glycosyltransferase involved in cell wall biosynthesis